MQIENLQNLCKCQLDADAIFVAHIKKHTANAATNIQALFPYTSSHDTRVFSCAYGGKYTEIDCAIEPIDGTKFVTVSFSVR
jgi:hypothetical protein